MRKRPPPPRLIADDANVFIDVPTEDADALRDYLFRCGIHGTVSYDVMGQTARLDVSDVGGEWAQEVLRQWKG
jgi:hypothetical protein